MMGLYSKKKNQILSKKPVNGKKMNGKRNALFSLEKLPCAGTPFFFVYGLIGFTMNFALGGCEF